MTNAITRRSVVLGLAAAPLLAQPAFAVSQATAENLVRQAVAEITATVNSGQSESRMYGDFQRILNKYADVPTIARYSLGADARSASSAQLNAYTSAFTGYLSRKYGKRFRDFIGGTVEVKGSRNDRNFVIVEAVANLRGESPIAVDFLVSDRSGQAKFFNVIIEGVNLLTSERTEIGAMLDQNGGSIDRVTQVLQRSS